ncbi:peptidoglycan DD-metalloendopeptidase family protein [Patescibacteria group bacterium]|nr:peptidoglycan DD-metalloendopeptidase family protein [Patescibacteria group bacterium]
MQVRGISIVLSSLVITGACLAFAMPAAQADEASSTVVMVDTMSIPTSMADDDPSAGQVDATQQQISAKEKKVKALDEVIAQYRARVEQQMLTAASLQAQLALLDAQADVQTASIARANAEAERLALVIEQTGKQIQTMEATLTVRRALLEDAIVHLDESDQTSPLLAMLSEKSLSGYVSRREDWRAVETNLAQLVADVNVSKKALEDVRLAAQTAQTAQMQQIGMLFDARQKLDEERNAKLSLVRETHNREDQYRRLMADLARQQQNESDSASSLRDQLRTTIDTSDDTLARGEVLLDWPIEAKKGISAVFHDHSYPFRDMFEHPGIDLPAPVGTPVRAAAGGYIAWNRTGKQYGNYIMIIHPNGIASVYGHLSAFVAKPDTYVERGEIIGYSGGRPGDQGAGLSTGAHLHFEVRQDGIPVDPLPFLPEMGE